MLKPYKQKKQNHLSVFVPYIPFHMRSLVQIISNLFPLIEHSVYCVHIQGLFLSAPYSFPNNPLLHSKIRLTIDRVLLLVGLRVWSVEP